MIEHAALERKVREEMRRGLMVLITPILPEHWERKMPDTQLMWMCELSIKNRRGDWRRIKEFNADPEEALYKAMRRMYPKRAGQKKVHAAVKKPRR